MSNSSRFHWIRPAPRPHEAGGGGTRLEPGRLVGLWPGSRSGPHGVSLAATLLAPFLFVVFSGCGGATAPCPTPTSELDQLRTRSERLEQDMEQAAGKEDEIAGEREEALRRMTEAQAAIDSITGARKR